MENRRGVGKIAAGDTRFALDARARDAVMEDGMKALALVDAPDHVCCRYRVRAFEPALNRAGWTLDTLGLARGLAGRVTQLARLPRYDAIVLQRKLLPGWQLRVLRRKAGRLVFDFDDAVLFRDSNDPRGPISAGRERRFSATVRAADLVIAGNDFLAGCAVRAGARADRVRVVPTCVNPDRYRPAADPGTGGLDLVWIGSSSTLRGLEGRRGLWEKIARGVPGVRMRVVCDRFPRFETMPVVGVDWSEDREAEALGLGGVGVSWIPDDVWSRGKCGLKVLQYQAAALPVLANPVGVHPEMIEPGETGWLPRTTRGWVEAVRALADDPALRVRMGRAARASVAARYSVGAWEATFVAAVAGASPVAAVSRGPSGDGRPRQGSGLGGPVGATG